MKKINFYVRVTHLESIYHKEVVTLLAKDGSASKALKQVEKEHPEWIGKLRADPWLTLPDPTSNDECHRITNIAELPKGRYFKLVSSATLKVSPVVYVRGDYDRTTKTYEAFRFDDVNSYQYFKHSRLVCVDFTV